MLRYRLAGQTARDLTRISPAVRNAAAVYNGSRHFSISLSLHGADPAKAKAKRERQQRRRRQIPKVKEKKEKKIQAPNGPIMTDLEYQRSLWEAQDPETTASSKTSFFTPAQWLDKRKNAASASKRQGDRPSDGYEDGSPSETKASSSSASSETKKPDASPSILKQDALSRLRSARSKESKRKAISANSSVEASKKPTSESGVLTRAPNPNSREALPNDTFNTMKPAQIHKLRPGRINFQPVEVEDLEVPSLSYGLDRVLFNSGVYEIVDHRTQVFNFDPYLTKFMPVKDFDFDALKEYITSSKDTKLQEMAKKHKRKYCGSTSSMTSILSQFHFLLSAFRKPNVSMLSKSFEPESYNFTRITTAPAAAYARLNDGVYAIDADKEFDTENVLAMLGKSMEKLLTLPREDFEKYRHSQSHRITEEERNADEVYHYTTLGDFLMRSQLDAHDARLPGSGVFDLKTRAVVSIRMDIKEYQQGMDYQIKTRRGQWESFEREYYDLIRSAFLKYSLQVRMGRMDGIFLAYHNTKRIFGFQYVSLQEMDEALHGTTDTRLGDQEFKASVAMLNECLDKATQKFPGRTLRIHAEARSNKYPSLYFFAQPVTEAQVRESQEKDATRVVERVKDQMKRQESAEPEAQEDAVEAEKEVRESEVIAGSQVEEAQTASNEDNSSTEVEEADITPSEEDDASASVWEDIMSKVDEFTAEESQGLSGIKEALQEALEEANMLYLANNDEMEEALDEIVAQLVADSSGLREDNTAAQDETALEEEESREVEETAEREVEEKESASEKAEVSPEASDDSGEQEVEEKQSTLEQPEGSPGAPAVPETPDVSAVEAEQESATSTEDLSQEEDDSHWTSQKEALKELFVKLVKDIDSSRKEKGPFEKALAKIAGQGSTESTDTATSSVDKQPAQENTWKENSETPTSSDRPSAEALSEPTEIMGLVVTCRNKVNDKYVGRVDGPESKGEEFNWQVEYNLTEMKPQTTARVYQQLKTRRYAAYNADKDQTQASVEFRDAFRGMLKEMSKKGKTWRKNVEKKYRGKEVLVAWDEKPLPPKARRLGVSPPNLEE